MEVQSTRLEREAAVNHHSSDSSFPELMTDQFPAAQLEHSLLCIERVFVLAVWLVNIYSQGQDFPKSQMSGTV